MVDQIHSTLFNFNPRVRGGFTGFNEALGIPRQGWDSGSEGATSGTKALEGADCHRRRNRFSEADETYGSEREC